jgi:hypothetical protein
MENIIKPNIGICTSDGIREKKFKKSKGRRQHIYNNNFALINVVIKII